MQVSAYMLYVTADSKWWAWDSITFLMLGGEILFTATKFF